MADDASPALQFSESREVIVLLTAVEFLALRGTSLFQLWTCRRSLGNVPVHIIKHSAVIIRDGTEWSESRPDHFIPGERVPGTLSIKIPDKCPIANEERRCLSNCSLKKLWRFLFDSCPSYVTFNSCSTSAGVCSFYCNFHSKFRFVFLCFLLTTAF